MRFFVFYLLAIFSFEAGAATITMHCGNYTFEAIPNAMNKINGQTVTSQKIKMLGADETGIRIDMGLMPARDGNNYGFQYIHRPGTESRFLNVQLLQNSMDAPRVIGTYDCQRVK